MAAVVVLAVVLSMLGVQREPWLGSPGSANACQHLPAALCCLLYPPAGGGGADPRRS